MRKPVALRFRPTADSRTNHGRGFHERGMDFHGGLQTSCDRRGVRRGNREVLLQEVGVRGFSVYLLIFFENIVDGNKSVLAVRAVFPVGDSDGFRSAVRIGNGIVRARFRGLGRQDRRYVGLLSAAREQCAGQRKYSRGACNEFDFFHIGSYWYYDEKYNVIIPHSGRTYIIVW